jgi:hypothetical protein
MVCWLPVEARLGWHSHSECLVPGDVTRQRDWLAERGPGALGETWMTAMLRRGVMEGPCPMKHASAHYPTISRLQATALAQRQPSLAGTAGCDDCDALEASNPRGSQGPVVHRYTPHPSAPARMPGSVCVSASLRLCLPARLPPFVWWHRTRQHARLRAPVSRELRHSVLTT